jgi:NLI interacting factor-like phosphatase
MNCDTQSPLRVLALDLEGTLISNAISCFPRPGLHAFLDFCEDHFHRVVLFTTVPETRGRSILDTLIAEGAAPPWLRQIEFVSWSGAIKDLRFIHDAQADDVLLVDDHEGYVHAEQRAQWVPILTFAAPYPDTDRELMRVTEEVRARLGI